MNEHLEHDSPVRWLTNKLHAGTTLAQRVRVMRARRWRKEAIIELEEKQQLEQQQQEQPSSEQEQQHE